jgi:hypothetical protein
MDSKIIKSISLLIAISIILFGIHKIIFTFFELENSEIKFKYPLVSLYSLFTTATLLIYIISILISKKNFDVVGMSFMLMTSVKTIIFYVLIRSVVKGTFQINHIEKINFMITFFLFLAIETIFVIRLLNPKKLN